MKIVEIENQHRPLKQPLRARYCDSFLCQLRGLMFRRALDEDEGLLLVQKRANRTEASIHMLFMWIDLAVVWIDAAHQVVDVQYARRWRPMYVPQFAAKYVLELPAARLDEFQVGDQLQFDETNLD